MGPENVEGTQDSLAHEGQGNEFVAPPREPYSPAADVTGQSLGDVLVAVTPP